MTAQACARELVTVEGKALERLEYKGIPVVTLRQVDEVHSRPAGTASRNFLKNKKQFMEGSDFLKVSGNDIRGLGVNGNCPTGLTLLTETGYLMIAKSFTDDLAWKVQRQLVDNYFKRKVAPSAPTNAMELLKSMHVADLISTLYTTMQAQQQDIDRLKTEVVAQTMVMKQMRATLTAPQAPAKQIELEFQGKETLLKQDSGHRSMENPLYARFRKLYPNRTLTWFKKRHKIPLTLETLTRIIYRNGKCDPVTLTVTCSYLKFTQDEVKEAAKYFGIKDKLGVFSLYDTKGATRK